MVLNVSQLLDYQKCPLFWYFRHVKRRGPPPYDGALKDGTYWHKLAEAWLTENPLLPPSDGTVQDAMRHFVEEGNLPRIPVVAAEKVLEMPLGRHTLVGTLDGIEPTSDGKFYSLQWKTCAGGNDLERQCDAVRWSYHEVAYETLMNANGYPCAGTHLGVWKKLTKAEREAGTWPLHFYVLERPQAYVAQVLEEIKIWAAEMSAFADGELQFPYLRPHRRSCIIANMRCSYFDVCYNGKPLSDSSLVDLEARY
jgi:hypothetical protein